MLKENPQEALEFVKASKQSEKEALAQIEYEEVTIRVPKLIMDFLRAREKDLGQTVKEYIEYNVVGTVSADIDAGDVFVPVPEEVAKSWKLNPIFKTILNDPIT